MAENRVELIVDAKAAAAEADIDVLKGKLNDLGRTVAIARAKTDVSPEDQVKLARMEASLLRLGRMVSKPKVTTEGFAKAEADVLALDLSLDKLGKQDAPATETALTGLQASMTALAGGGGGGGGGMMALVTAGAALSPILATVGVGLGSLAILAAGSVAPVIKAAQATGGLQANMHKLDPDQQQAAKSLLSLEGAYKDFSKALEPEVLKVFNAGLADVRPLMADVQPAAKAAGNALAQMLGAVGTEFKSGEWQQFFGFMAAEAGPDMRQLTGLVVDLTKSLPPLLEGLQPVGSALVTVTDDIAKALGPIGQFGKDIQASTDVTFGIVRAIDRSAVAFTNMIPGGKAVNDGLTRLQHSLSGTGDAAASAAVSTRLQVDAATALAQRTGDLIHPLGDAGEGMGVLAHHATDAATAERAMAGAVNATTDSLVKGLAPLQNYIGATLTQRNDEAALKTALKASGDQIGLKTQKQRDSFGAAQTYLKDTLSQAQAAITAHKSTQTEISSLQTAIGVLSSVGGKTAEYRSELALLKAELDRIRAEKDITKYVTVVTRDVKPGGFQEFHAAGGIIGAAGGGPRGGMTWVGERGPELVRLPLGSTVFPAGQSAAMAAQQGGSGGNNYSINVTVAPGGHPGETGRQIVQMIREFEKRSGSSWRN